MSIPRFLSTTTSKPTLKRSAGSLPFPLSGLRIGIDICAISRIEGILRPKVMSDRGGGGGDNARAKRFIKRVLSPREIEEGVARRAYLRAIMQSGGAVTDVEGYDDDEDDDEASLKRASVFLAGRWAAKEAAVKAHPWRRLVVGDEKTLDRDNGSDAPVVVIRGNEEEGMEDQMALVSISHDGDYATAVCVGFDPEVFGKEDAGGVLGGRRMEEIERRLEAVEGLMKNKVEQVDHLKMRVLALENELEEARKAMEGRT
ncbi:hypothetical protein QBC43DRAFT_221322 [Cladorrhinum sp. PSN259]|nr:hypothetical protein QBC43DRAFT_221322 [Cladorrhinum sp. PSN259]